MTMAFTLQSNGHGNGPGIEALLGGVAQGDTAALEALYAAMRTPVYSFALSLLKNAQDAEDVLHDCFLHVYGAAATYESRGKGKAWVLTIARNLCMQRLRERTRVTSLPEEGLPSAAYAPEGVSPEDRLVLTQCMTMLTEEERQIVVLHAASGLKHREIAAMLSLPLPTVLSKYNRALKKLRRFL